MLISAKPTLQTDIQKLMYDAAREAYLTSQETGDADPIISKRMKQDQEKAADRFAKAFSNSCCQPLADAIYKFVKEIGIIMTPSGALISTSIMSPSPVAGQALMTDFAIY